MWSGLIEGCRCPETSIVLLGLAQEHLLVRGKSASTSSGRILVPCPWSPIFHGTIFTLHGSSFKLPRRHPGRGRGGWPQRGPSLCRVVPRGRQNSLLLFQRMCNSSLHLPCRPLQLLSSPLTRHRLQLIGCEQFKTLLFLLRP